MFSASLKGTQIFKEKLSTSVMHKEMNGSAEFFRGWGHLNDLPFFFLHLHTIDINQTIRRHLSYFITVLHKKNASSHGVNSGKFHMVSQSQIGSPPSKQSQFVKLSTWFTLSGTKFSPSIHCSYSFITFFLISTNTMIYYITLALFFWCFFLCVWDFESFYQL